MQTVEGRNVSVTAGSKFDLPLLVKTPSHVEWSFSFAPDSAGMDISFGVQLAGTPSAHGPTQTEVVASARVSDGGNTSGSFAADTGMCHFVWDNSHSWFTAKTICYTIKLRDSSGGEVEAVADCFQRMCLLQARFYKQSADLVKNRIVEASGVMS